MCGRFVYVVSYDKLKYQYEDLEGYRVSTLVNKADFDHPLAMERLP